VTAQIFGVPSIISATGKATDFKFCRNIHIGSIETKAHENVGNSGRWRSQESLKFSGHPYVGRIARSSLRQHSFLV